MFSNSLISALSTNKANGAWVAENGSYSFIKKHSEDAIWFDRNDILNPQTDKENDITASSSTSKKKGGKS